MMALSVRQPWAQLIVNGLKTVEIRTWITDYRGPLGVHCAIEVDKAAARRFSYTDALRGHLIGSVELIAIVPFTPARWEKWADQHLDLGPWRSGLYAWVLFSPCVSRQPVSMKGGPKLFEIQEVTR